MELVDFIQLNKDVRKMFRMKLKARFIGVTLRAPEKPIYLDIDKANAIRVLSILFDNIEKYAEEGSRVYIEMYAQNGKMIYLMKNTIRADLINQTTNAMGHGSWRPDVSYSLRKASLSTALRAILTKWVFCWTWRLNKYNQYSI